jgi:hypothetical protein
MTKEQDEKHTTQLELTDAITDFGIMLQKYGCSYIAKELKEYYPEFANELGHALIASYKPVAAILKKG